MTNVLSNMINSSTHFLPSSCTAPFSGAFTGANYKVYGNVKSTDLASLRNEVKQVSPVAAFTIKHATAPPFKEIKEKFNASIYDGAFAALISGYFVPPLTGMYNFVIEGHFQAMLSFSVEKKSIETGIERQTSFNGDTGT